MKWNFLIKLCFITQVAGASIMFPAKLIDNERHRAIRKHLANFFKKSNNNKVLEKASEQGLYHVVRFLVTHGNADPCYNDAKSLTRALSGKHKSTYRFLLNSIDNLQESLNGKINYIFRLACSIGDLQTAEEIRTKGVDIDDLQGFALRLSFLNNEIASVRYLLEHGARIDFFDKKWILRCLPIFIGMENRLKNSTQKSGKEEKNILQSAIIEYCLRARLLEKWFVKATALQDLLRQRKRKKIVSKPGQGVDPGLLYLILSFID